MTKSYVTEDKLKKAIEYLRANKGKQICYRWKVCANTEDSKNIYIVLGWKEIPDEPSKYKDKYYYNGYRLAVKVGYQPSNSVMQCDYDIDFGLPCFTNGEVIVDCEGVIYKSTNFSRLVYEMNNSASWVIKNWKELKHD